MTEQELRLKTAETEKSSHLDYFNIAVSVDCVIFGYDKKDLKVLLPLLSPPFSAIHPSTSTTQPGAERKVWLAR